MKNSFSLSSKNEQKPVFGVRELEEKDFIFTSESVQKDQKEVVSQDRKSGNNDSPTKETISSLPEMSKGTFIVSYCFWQQILEVIKKIRMQGRIQYLYFQMHKGS